MALLNTIRLPNTGLTHTRLWRLLFSPAPETYPAHRLYVALSEAARNPFFYEKAHVADTIDGRFDLHVVHVFLALERLKREAESDDLRRALLECFFSSLDRSLREMGVGDLGVGRRIRKMADACHGRITRYTADWANAETRRTALIANVYRGDVSVAEQGIDALMAELARFESLLASLPLAALTQGELKPHAA